MLYEPRYQALREELVEARVQAGLTQSVLAKRVNRTQSFISKVESGERYVDVIDLISWCEATQADPCQILAKVMAIPKRKMAYR